MRLNPYHPQRYWTHLARALFHAGNYEDALSALANITKPRIDDHVYGIVANQMLGNVDASCERVAELMRRFPEFDVSAFIESLPYTDPVYRQAVAKPLESAVRQAGK